ncbi:MAG TPA: hypothetical protein VM821_07125 [Abditibacteriaceae bacterium]|nr:hypothetical protein [Abditibacteriaceae bacterium]
MKNRVLILGVVAASAAVALAGCGDVASSSSPRHVLKTALQAREIGRAFDEGQRALQSGNIEALVQSSDELRRLGAAREEQLLTGEAAEQLVLEATRIEMAAQSLSSTRKAQMQAQAAQRYRLALRLSPNFSSNDPQILNALGYFLADRGESLSDFQTGEKLVRRALGVYARRLQAQPELASPQFQYLRAITRDSLAWALFRQKKYEQAWNEQKIAVAEAQSAGAQLGLAATDEAIAELLSHWLQIGNALGRKPQLAPVIPPPSPKPSPLPEDEEQNSPDSPLTTA